MWHFLYKKCKLWVIKAYDRAKNEMIAWVTGSRSAKTFRRLYEKVKHLKGCTFYTDSWDAFSTVSSNAKHVIGKQHTVAIKRDNSNVRNDLVRFTRRTKVVSKPEKMVNKSLKFWQAFQTSNLFSILQKIILSIFKLELLNIFKKMQPVAYVHIESSKRIKKALKIHM